MSAIENTLTVKENRFVDEYCIDCNATQAAIRAGYSKRTARQIGYENLTKPYILDAILQKMDANGMKSQEALKRLTDYGRATFAYFLSFSEGGSLEINLTSEEAQKHLHLIKKIKQTKRSITTKGHLVETITYEVELHDSKDAIKTLLEVMGKVDQPKGELTVNITF